MTKVQRVYGKGRFDGFIIGALVATALFIIGMLSKKQTA
jgi:hypothetical protein